MTTERSKRAKFKLDVFASSAPPNSQLDIICILLERKFYDGLNASKNADEGKRFLVLTVASFFGNFLPRHFYQRIRSLFAKVKD